MLKAYKYRIYPTNKQAKQLHQTFGCCRFIYNWALAFKTDRYKKFLQNVSRFELCKMITFFKTTEERKWLNDVNSQSLQAEIRHLETGFTNFFRKNASYPKCKKKFGKQSFECPQNVKIDFDDKIITIPKIGPLQYRDKRKPFNGEIKTCTVSFKNEKYFISILVDDGKDLPAKVEISNNNSIGIDLGLIDFITTSEGVKIPNPRNLKKLENKIKFQQRRLSRKVKRSNNWIKQKRKISRLYGRLTDMRCDFLHKLSTNIVKNHDTIFVEDLNVKGMARNHKLAKSISDASWGEFIRQLKYKSEWAGKNLIKIGRFDPSSKLCTCGYLNKDLKLSDRIWICPQCKSINDRDKLAADNIKRFGLMKIKYCATDSGLDKAGVLVEACVSESMKQETRRFSSRAPRI